MVNISYKVLDILTEDEILLVCKNSDVDIFLKVFRDEKDKNKYKKYVQKLGRIDKKTNMAQTFGPIFAFELYKKGDKSFVSAIATATESLGEKFLQIVSSTNKDITRNLLSAYTDDELTKLYIDVLEKWKGFSSELFFLVLKINGIIIDDFRNIEIKAKIAAILKRIEEAEKIEKKIDDEKKKLEKELNQHFTAEKGKLLRDNRALLKHNEQLKKQVDEAEHALSQLRDRDEREKERYFVESKKQVDQELKIYKKEQEERLNDDIKIKKQSMLQTIKDEECQRKQEIADKFDESIKAKEKEMVDLNREIERMQSILEECGREQEHLKIENEKLIEEQERLKQIEEEYLRNVKERFLQAELDKSLLQIVNSGTVVTECSESINGVKLPIISNSDFWTKETEVSQEASELEDFIQDFSDNIALVFDNSNEIAAIVIAAILNKKPVIIEESIAGYIAGCLAALIDLKSTGVIDINGAEKDIAVKAIKDYAGRVVVVNGVLSVYDELLFNYICQECSDKYIFMTISDVKDIKLFSKSVLNKAIILDIEQDYTFMSNDPLWIGEHSIEQFAEVETKEDLRKRYEKNFRSLVSEQVCSKVVAVELSKVLNCYLRTMTEIGEVFSRTMRFYLDDRNIDSDELKKLLEKNGWK